MKWLWDEFFFISYHLKQSIPMIKMTLTPLDRKIIINQFVEQREKETKQLNKK